MQKSWVGRLKSTSRFYLGLATALLSLTTAPAFAASKAEQQPDYRTAYSHFLVGRFALSQGDMGTAASALETATLSDPSNADLRQKAFLIGILSGDIDRAAQMVTLTGKPDATIQLMGSLIEIVRSVKAGHNAAAEKTLDALVKTNGDDRSVVMLRPIVQALNGQWDKALDDSNDAALANSDRDRLLVYLIKAERARLQEIKGHPEAAEALYKGLYQPGAASVIFGPDYANFLERRGRKDEAKVIWQTIASVAVDPQSTQALKRLNDPTAAPPALPDLKLSMAQALFLSSTLYFSEHDAEMALANLRLSLYLDNSLERERIFLGQIEMELKDSQAAEAAWASIPDASPFANEANLRRVWSLRSRDQVPDALSLVDQVLSRDPDNLSFVVEKADILHAQDKDAAALAILDARISRAGSADFTWQALFLQAMIYDSLGRWPDAETAIQKAQALNAQSPEILNFLGYGWIDHGLHVKEGMDLVRQALNLSPKSGAIIDSLGWGYYKMGNYDEALGFAEQAVQLDPSDAEVNDHLGDVYKALGRNVEAGYEWQRVLTLNPTDKETVTVQQKIAANVTAVKPMVETGQPGTKREATAFNDDGKKSAKSRP